ncbi:MAG TPA: prolyl oligopeptidase family serine peptidase [Pirellulales bacterium]|nr:prolyl oligopeptidase family serine peptidase [Pirellulales bacterium]
MSEKEPRQYGLWTSPITPGSLAEGRRLDGVAWAGDGELLVWLEGRSGKGVLVAKGPGDAPRDLTTELSVRAEVGYGGGDFTVQDDWVCFVVHKTGRLFRQSLSGGGPAAITPAFGQAAAPVASPDGRWIAYVHHDDPHDRIGVVDSEGKLWPQILTAGHDFYMQPRFSPDGKQFCWIAWDHPNMPWDGTRLYLADIATGDGLPRLVNAREIAGGPEVAVFQPEFTPDGRYLVYVSDETGWGRLTAHDLASGTSRWLTPEGEEFAMPAWVQDMRTYAVLGDGRTLVAAGSRNGYHRLQMIDIPTGNGQAIDGLAGYSDVSCVAAAAAGAKFAFIASSPKRPPRVVTHDLKTGATQVVARSSGETVPDAALADCEAISWKTAGGGEAHGLLYRPASDRYRGIGRPPLVTLIHGGPTSQVRAGWRAEAQFFATRGYTVLLVNYRGSTGYGRAYMLELRGNWGICDVEDATTGMRHLADVGQVDGERTVIMGGSAGGFTVLQTMATDPEAFSAGISLYGVANQFSLASDTHKFESRYLDSMLGPLPEAAAIYRQRSPVFHAANIRRPLAVFQGGIDTVVPKDQAEAIVEALQRNETPHIYHVYEDEGHGWRKRETIEHFYQAVEQFLRRYLIYA